MEIHSVLPEERAKDPSGEFLPWGYRYADSTRNVRLPEESGPFGRNRSFRLGSRASRTRTGTTPVRQKENTTVADFGRLLAKEQAKEEERRPQPSGVSGDDAPRAAPELIATECMLYGYGTKNIEWKVLSKLERIVAPSLICEDYSREDPNLALTNSPLAFSTNRAAIHKNLSKDALRKSRVYQGGQHWIKITFDSYQAAEKACFYSPIEVDGHLIHCEIWQGTPPTDVPIPKASGDKLTRSNVARTVGPATSAQYKSGKDAAIAGFERAMTLPRSMALPDVQYAQPQENDGSATSTTASSATAREVSPTASRSRPTPQSPIQDNTRTASQYMTHIPSVKRAVLRPVSEALPPQLSFAERVLSSLPIISWFVGSRSATGAVIGEGPALKEDGSWDENNGWYWSFWYSIDRIFGTDLCALKEE